MGRERRDIGGDGGREGRRMSRKREGSWEMGTQERGKWRCERRGEWRE